MIGIGQLSKRKYMKKFDIIKSKQRCKDYRLEILEISQKVQALHLGGAYSCMEIVDLIYFNYMRKKNKNFIDTFLMSKGHSCMAQYVILEKLKILKKKDLEDYCTSEGILGCHPDYGNPGIEASTGSLGHGLGLAAGMVQADKINKRDRKTFVLISDGELQEGSTWENMMMAANLELKNLVVFLDHNGSQSFGQTKLTHPKFYPIKEKVLSFNWDCVEIFDGHDQKEIIKKTSPLIKKNKKPVMIICNTVKGKGVSYMENEPIWHYRSPTKEEYKIAIKELNQNAK